MAILTHILICLAGAVLADAATSNQGMTVGTDYGVNWTSVRASPNATGSITFSAPNVSTPFPGVADSAVPGWTMSIAVRADTSPNVTATSISLSGPASLQFPNGTTMADPSWRACLYTAGPSTKGGFSNGSFDDGACGSALGSSCVRDWLSAAAAVVYDGWACPALALPRSCSSAFAAKHGMYSEDLHANFSGADVLNWATTDVTYDDAVGRVWPTMIRWQGNEAAENTSSAGTNATLQCVQAYDVLAGSRLPSTGERTGGMSGLAVAAALAAALYSFFVNYPRS